eukprot:scaffold160322_cov18-Tisochrysis_lutea.AAC.1
MARLCLHVQEHRQQQLRQRGPYSPQSALCRPADGSRAALKQHHGWGKKLKQHESTSQGMAPMDCTSCMCLSWTALAAYGLH